MARLKSVRVVVAGGGSRREEIDIREPIDIEVDFWIGDLGRLRPTVNLSLYNDEGVCLFMTNDWHRGDSNPATLRGNVVRSTCRIPGNFLAEGRFTVNVAVSTFSPPIAHALERDAVAFQIVDHSEGDGVRGEATIEWPGWCGPCSSGTPNTREPEA